MRKQLEFALRVPDSRMGSGQARFFIQILRDQLQTVERHVHGEVQKLAADVRVRIHPHGEDLGNKTKSGSSVPAAVKVVWIFFQVRNPGVDLVRQIGDHQIALQVDHDKGAGPSLVAYGV